jgi:hypothetical protein
VVVIVRTKDGAVSSDLGAVRYTIHIVYTKYNVHAHEKVDLRNPKNGPAFQFPASDHDHDRRYSLLLL